MNKEFMQMEDKVVTSKKISQVAIDSYEWDKDFCKDICNIDNVMLDKFQNFNIEGKSKGYNRYMLVLFTILANRNKYDSFSNSELESLKDLLNSKDETTLDIGKEITSNFLKGLFKFEDNNPYFVKSASPFSV